MTVEPFRVFTLSLTSFSTASRIRCDVVGVDVVIVTPFISVCVNANACALTSSPPVLSTRKFACTALSVKVVHVTSNNGLRNCGFESVAPRPSSTNMLPVAVSAILVLYYVRY